MRFGRGLALVRGGKTIGWSMLVGFALTGEAAAQASLPPVTVEPEPVRRRAAVASAPISPARGLRHHRGVRRASPAPRPSPAPAAMPSAPAAEAASDGLAGIAGPGRGALSPVVSALPANTTTLDGQTIRRLPIFSYGDIFRPLGGFDVSNYGQGGVGYGIALRGFSDGDHGKDIAYFIDGEIGRAHV